MTDNNNVAMNAETPETEIPVAPTLEPGGPVAPAPMTPIPDAEAEVPVAPAPAEQTKTEEPKTGTITITITEADGGHKVDTNIDGSFNGMAFIAGLADALSAISEASEVPDFIILAKLIEVYRGNAANDEEEQDHEDKDV